MTRAWSPARTVLFFAALAAATAVAFRIDLAAAITLSWKDDRYLSIAAGPVLCLFFLNWERAAIFPQERPSPLSGSLLIGISMLSGVLFSRLHPDGIGSVRQTFIILCVVLVWISGFVLRYGMRSFRSASFALYCLFLMIPIPPAGMDWMTSQLQQGSAAVSLQVLRFAGVPVFREGMRFMLPGLVFEVAPECSGLHSWVAFVIAALFATRLYLQSRWMTLTLVALTVPIAIVKNALRIVIIALLSAYVDPSIISSPLHRHGGPLFALVDLSIFIPLMLMARRMESRRDLPAARGDDETAREPRAAKKVAQILPTA